MHHKQQLLQRISFDFLREEISPAEGNLQCYFLVDEKAVCLLKPTHMPGATSSPQLRLRHLPQSQNWLSLQVTLTMQAARSQRQKQVIFSRWEIPWEWVWGCPYQARKFALQHQLLFLSKDDFSFQGCWFCCCSPLLLSSFCQPKSTRQPNEICQLIWSFQTNALPGFSEPFVARIFKYLPKSSQSDLKPLNF